MTICECCEVQVEDADIVWVKVDDHAAELACYDGVDIPLCEFCVEDFEKNRR